MIIFGWGRVTKKFIGDVFQKTCEHCGFTNTWKLCIVRTWFTLFFIPIIPYSKKYCIMCPNCGCYYSLTEDEFLNIKAKIYASNNQDTYISDDVKYAGKTETQINFIKEMEKQNNKMAE